MDIAKKIGLVGRLNDISDLGFESGFGCVNLVKKPRILQLLGLEYCKRNGSRKLKMLSGEKLYSGSHILQGTKGDL